MNATAALSGLWDIRTSNGKFFDQRQAERIRWFRKIAPRSGNWKDPIDAIISAADFADCNNAAIWFTGGGLTIVASERDQARVTGAGYYVNIGA